MALIVQKFGGSSVANADRVRNVARIITETYKKGNSVVVVLSAQGDTTDDLIAKAQELNPNASKREMDMLLSTGEQISIALCAMTIEGMGYQVVSLTGWQAGMNTDSAYSNARIKRIQTERIQTELDKNKIVLVAGFQGINKYGDITTLGRGAQAGGDHLRRDAGAGQPGRPGAPQPLGGDGQALQCQSGGPLQLHGKSRYKSQGGCQDHGKDPCKRCGEG